MSQLTVKKTALAFALFSFGVMTFGSVLTGAGFFTALVRGTEAAFVFGFLALGLGSMLAEKSGEDLEGKVGGEAGRQKGINLDQTV